MKYIYIIILVISLSCCDNKKGNHPVSSEKTFTYAEQQKALGAINFGVSKKQFDKLYNKFFKSKNCESGCTIGKFEYYNQYAKFKNDQLYYLEFANIGLKNNGHDKFIPEIVDDAYQAVRSEYGEPDSSRSLSAWKADHIFTVHKWIIGKKTIEIKVDKVNMQLGVRLLIYNML